MSLTVTASRLQSNVELNPQCRKSLMFGVSMPPSMPELELNPE
jgi:hypothetical protein